jgi:hypothetical protein
LLGADALVRRATTAVSIVARLVAARSRATRTPVNVEAERDAIAM